MYTLMKFDWDEIIVRLLSQELKDVPYEVLIGVLRTVGEVEKDIFTADRIKIYRICAVDLFITSNEYLLDEFIVAYNKVVELTVYRKFLSSFKLEDVIQGIAIQRIQNYRATVRYFPEVKLSYILEDRMQAMFAIKDKWTEAELTVYLADVTSLTIPQLLLKHTKKIIEGNTVMYTSKLK